MLHAIMRQRDRLALLRSLHPSRTPALTREESAVVVQQMIRAGGDVNMRLYPAAPAVIGSTLLYTLAEMGYAEAVSVLLDAGAAVDLRDNDWLETALIVASWRGYTNIVKMLLDAAADVNQTDKHGRTALTVASSRGWVATVRALLYAGADVEEGQDVCSRTPLHVACHNGRHHRHLECVQLLSSYNASRTVWFSRERGNGVTAESVATERGHTEIAEWLASTRLWSTPLHHLSVIDSDFTRAELRGGADLHAAGHLRGGAAEAALLDRQSRIPTHGPTPLSLAQQMEPIKGSPADLVLRAAEPWSQANHGLFPDDARESAVQLLFLGYRLSRDLPIDRANGRALLDVWVGEVMPLLVTREMEWLMEHPLALEVASSESSDDMMGHLLSVVPDSVAPSMHVSRLKRYITQRLVRLLRLGARFGARRMMPRSSSAGAL